MPKLTGTAINSAMPDVTSVPTIGTRAPNSSVTGFHSALVRKLKPNAFIAGRLPITRETMMAASSTSTEKAEMRVIPRNRISGQFWSLWRA